MKKKTGFLIFGLLLFIAGTALGRKAANFGYVSVLEHADSDTFLEGVTGLFSSEPSEIQALREKDYPVTEEGHIEYYFHQLNLEEQRVYRQILEGVRALEPEFYLTTSDAAELDRAYHAVLKDHPEIFWIHNRQEVYRTTYGDSSYCLFAPGYGYEEAEIQEIRQTMEEAYQEVRAGIPENADTYDIVKAVYIYVIDLAEYELSDHDQCIAGIFQDHNAVCAGYARAVQYLLERLGVYCIYVDGEVKSRSDGHAWNIVKIGDEYYYLDATNGDQPEFLEGDAAALAEHKTILMDYLCPFPLEYEANYTASEEFLVPECTARDMNFYVLNQGCFDSYDRQSIFDYCCMRIGFNAAVVRFKFSNRTAFDEAYEEYITQEAVKDVAQYYMQAHGLYEVQYHYGVLEDLKSIYFIF